MSVQCLQQCHQCHHSAYSSAIKNELFSLVTALQCLQCLQISTTHLHMRMHAYMGRLLCRSLMALMALGADDLRKHPVVMALSAGTVRALVMALPSANRTNPGGTP